MNTSDLNTMPNGMLECVWYLWKESVIDIYGAMQVYSHFGYNLNYITRESVEVQKQKEVLRFKTNQ